MSTGHTPGPWRAETHCVWGPDDTYIAGTRTGLSDDECDANAALIAAAPELLAALKYAQEIIATARQYFPKSIRHSDRFQLENTCAAINKAIDKAEGR